MKRGVIDVQEEVKKKKRSLLKPSRLAFLIILALSNTFAWFIYATKIDSNVSVHVRAWNVVFEAGDNLVTDTINLTVDSIYPGMEDYEYVINAYNHGDVSASLSYQILSARILDQEYISKEGRAANGDAPVLSDLTSAQLEAKLANDYPFSITIDISNAVITQTNGEESYTLSVVWPYESNHDDVDTQWGIDAYEFKESNPTLPSITLRIKIIITQNANQS